jgi:hypothetical protein
MEHARHDGGISFLMNKNQASCKHWWVGATVPCCHGPHCQRQRATTGFNALGSALGSEDDDISLVVLVFFFVGPAVKTNELDDAEYDWFWHATRRLLG